MDTSSTPFVRFFGGHVDAKYIFHHVHRQHEQSHCHQCNDDDVTERFGYDLSNQGIFGRDLAVSAGEARPETLAAIIVRHRATDALVPAGDIATQVHSCLALHALPPRRT